MPRNSIMIVEDDPVSARITEMVLEQLGYAVAGVFDSGEESVRQASALKPDLVLMDIMLAGDMDGVRAAQLIRAAIGVPVIFLTATTDEVIGRVGESGAWGYIHKPVKLLDLKANLEMALSRWDESSTQRYARERRAALDALPMSVVLVGTSLEVRWANPMAERLLGLAVEVMVGQPARLVLSALFDPGEGTLRAALDGVSGALTLAGVDGGSWRMTASPAREEDGRLAGALVIFQPENQA